MSRASSAAIATSRLAGWMGFGVDGAEAVDADAGVALGCLEDDDAWETKYFTAGSPETRELRFWMGVA